MTDSVLNIQGSETGVVVGNSRPSYSRPSYSRVREVRDSLAGVRAREVQDSLAQVRRDSIAREHNHHGIVLTDPYGDQVVAGSGNQVIPAAGDGLSWVFGVLALLFCVVCLKFKNSPAYIEKLFNDMTSIRMRNNVFDNTVKETSFMVILNVGWIVCGGILLWNAVENGVGFFPPLQVGGGPDGSLYGVGICSGVCGCYLLFSIGAYWLAGNVFYDSKTTQLWINGATAGFGLETFTFLPLSLLSLCYPEWVEEVLIIVAIIFIICKIIFIYKGFRIFLRQNNSWLIFLYYLCSLEIIPLILAFVSARELCLLWLRA